MQIANWQSETLCVLSLAILYEHHIATTTTTTTTTTVILLYYDILENLLVEVAVS